MSTTNDEDKDNCLRTKQLRTRTIKIFDVAKTVIVNDDQEINDKCELSYDFDASNISLTNNSNFSTSCDDSNVSVSFVLSKIDSIVDEIFQNSIYKENLLVYSDKSNLAIDENLIISSENKNDLVQNLSELKLEMAFNIDTALKLIPNFDGKSSNLHKFTSCCDLMYNSITIDNDKKLFLEFLKNKLDGSAYDVVRYMKFENWNDLKKELELKFKEFKSVDVLQSELSNCKQQQNETVRNFVDRIQKLVSDLNEACINRDGEDFIDFIKKHNNASALGVFKNGLKYPLNIIVKSGNYNSLNDAINRAIEEEAFNSNLDSKIVENSKQNVNQPSQMGTKPKTPLQCQYCQKIGHSADKCYTIRNRIQSNPQSAQFNSTQSTQFSQNKNPKPGSSFANQNSNSQVPQNSRSNFPPNVRNMNVVCNYCKMFGHELDNCVKKLKKDLRDATSSQNSSLEIQSSSNDSGNLQPLEQDIQDVTVRVKNL